MHLLWLFPLVALLADVAAGKDADKVIAAVAETVTVVAGLLHPVFAPLSSAIRKR